LTDIFALLKLGAQVTLVRTQRVRSLRNCRASACGFRVVSALLPELDVINMLRVQHERQQKAYFPSLGEYTRSLASPRRAPRGCERTVW
jgi:aspartate carbamoyltransferase catalytic subunit